MNSSLQIKDKESSRMLHVPLFPKDKLNTKILANGLEPRRNLIMKKTKRKRSLLGASSAS